MTFKVNYRTEFGEALAIIGENDATGNWKDFSKGMMEWTQGDWWVVRFEVDPTLSFMYKYVVIDYDTRQPKRWEQGINRICDPEYIPRVSEFDSGTLQTIQDEWEHFTVTFSIYLPLTGDDPSAQYLRINGGTPRLGEWNKGEGPIAM